LQDDTSGKVAEYVQLDISEGTMHGEDVVKLLSLTCEHASLLDVLFEGCESNNYHQCVCVGCQN
jgi:hypothetical protein